VILLDTNVLSALMRDPPDAAVVAWLDGQVPDEVWTTAVSVFEVRFGLARLREGRRRGALEEAFEELLREDLAGRVAPVDAAAAEAAGRLAARRQSAGRAVDVRDTLIGGVALAQRAAVATRNARHFDDLETGVLNPWAATARP
jgi:predicted nucleic acid-binding protein